MRRQHPGFRVFALIACGHGLKGSGEFADFLFHRVDLPPLLGAGIGEIGDRGLGMGEGDFEGVDADQRS